MNCANCNAELHPVEGTKPPQYDNALAIEFRGGYGMFIDPFEGDDNYNVMLCHECAHRLCGVNPWIGNLLDPYNSHSHLPGSVPPDHAGWDLKAEYGNDDVARATGGIQADAGTP